MASQRNMHSARVHALVVGTYIEAEVQAGRRLGPFPPQARSQGYTGVVWMLCRRATCQVDEANHGPIINDGSDPHLCSLSYTSVEAVAAAAQQLGRGALLAKLDIKLACAGSPPLPSSTYIGLIPVARLKEPGIVIYCHYIHESGLGNFCACYLPWMW